MMPGVDGREVLREIRRLEEGMGYTTLSGVKIVMTTALSNYHDVAAAFRDQCDGYIAKPVQRINSARHWLLWGLSRERDDPEDAGFPTSLSGYARSGYGLSLRRNPFA